MLINEYFNEHYDGNAQRQRYIETDNRPTAKNRDERNFRSRVGTNLEIRQDLPFFTSKLIESISKLPLHAQILGIEKGEGDNREQRKQNDNGFLDRDAKAAYCGRDGDAPILDRSTITRDPRDDSLNHFKLRDPKFSYLFLWNAHATAAPRGE